MFKRKSTTGSQAIGTVAGDIEALEETLRLILDEVNLEEAWLHLQPHVDLALERAGGQWPIAAENIAEMLGKYGVERS